LVKFGKFCRIRAEGPWCVAVQWAVVGCRVLQGGLRLIVMAAASTALTAVRAIHRCCSSSLCCCSTSLCCCSPAETAVRAIHRVCCSLYLCVAHLFSVLQNLFTPLATDDMHLCACVQCVAVCCSTSQCVAVCCSGLRTYQMACMCARVRVMQGVAACCSVLLFVAVYCSVLQCVANISDDMHVCAYVVQIPDMVDSREQQAVAVYCSALQCVAVCCSVLQRVAVC